MFSTIGAHLADVSLPTFKADRTVFRFAFVRAGTTVRYTILLKTCAGLSKSVTRIEAVFGSIWTGTTSQQRTLGRLSLRALPTYDIEGFCGALTGILRT